MKTRPKTLNPYALPAILLLGFILRIWGIHFGLPHLYHADEPIVVNHALAYGAGDLNPHFFNIPPLVSYLLFMCYGVYFALGRLLGSFQSVQDFADLFFSDPTSFYLIARIVFGAILGTVTIYLLYRLVLKFFDRSRALLSAFFLSTCFLHARDSHYIYADIPLVLVLVAGFFSVFKITHQTKAVIPEIFCRGSTNPSTSGFPPGTCGNDTGHWRIHFLCGAMIGLATATKYNGVFLAIPYVWICLRTVPWKSWLGSWGLAVIAAAAVFFLLNPFSILDRAFFMKELAEQSASNTGGVTWSHHFTYSLAGGVGWPMLLIACFGILRALFNNDFRKQAIAIFIVAYYVVISRFGQPYDRYALPVIPFLLIFAADTLSGFNKKWPPLFWILMSAAVLPPLVKTIAWDRLMSAPDVRTVAKEWVEKNIPPGKGLALDWGFYMPRLAFSPEQLEEKKLLAANGFQSEAKIRRLGALLKKSYQPSYRLHFLSRNTEATPFLFGEPLAPLDVGTLRQKGIEYVLLVEALYSAGDPFVQELYKQADRMTTFSPYSNLVDLSIHDPQTMTGGPFLWRDLQPRTRNGYPISVFRLRN